MKIRKPSFISVFSSFFILIAVNLFGLLDFRTDNLWSLLNTYDVFLLGLTTIFIFYLFETKMLLRIWKAPHMRYFLFFFLFVIGVIVIMPIRGPISLIDSSRVARDYLVIPLAFLIYYDTLRKGHYDYYLKLFLFIAIATSMQIIVNAFSPEIIESMFPHVRAREGLKLGYQRNTFLASAMIFPHIACLFLFTKIEAGSRDKYIFFLFPIFFLASALQGFRVYFLTMMTLLLISWAKHIRTGKLIKGATGMMLLGAMIFILDGSYLNNQIVGKITTSISELSATEEGTLMGRYRRDQVFMYPMFYEKPLQGWGFIYHDSPYGKQIGMETSRYDKKYSLYSVDSGYLTLLIQFGVLGVSIILFFIFNPAFNTPCKRIQTN